jgi:hypothetical protein
MFILASKFWPRDSTSQAMRASLLASAITSTLGCSRFLTESYLSKSCAKICMGPTAELLGVDCLSSRY